MLHVNHLCKVPFVPVKSADLLGHGYKTLGVTCAFWHQDFVTCVLPVFIPSYLSWMLNLTEVWGAGRLGQYLAQIWRLGWATVFCWVRLPSEGGVGLSGENLQRCERHTRCFWYCIKRVSVVSAASIDGIKSEEIFIVVHLRLSVQLWTQIPYTNTLQWLDV